MLLCLEQNKNDGWFGLEEKENDKETNTQSIVTVSFTKIFTKFRKMISPYNNKPKKFLQR